MVGRNIANIPCLVNSSTVLGVFSELGGTIVINIGNGIRTGILRSTAEFKAGHLLDLHLITNLIGVFFSTCILTRVVLINEALFALLDELPICNEPCAKYLVPRRCLRNIQCRRSGYWRLDRTNLQKYSHPLVDSMSWPVTLQMLPGTS